VTRYNQECLIVQSERLGFLPPPLLLFSFSLPTSGFSKWEAFIPHRGQGRGTNQCTSQLACARPHLASGALDFTGIVTGNVPREVACALQQLLCTQENPAARGAQSTTLHFHQWEGQGGLRHWGPDRGKAGSPPDHACSPQTHGNKSRLRKLHAPKPGSCCN
jgi:hypothetical protein